MCSSDLLEIAEQLRSATARTGALLLVNDRIDVALAVGADGVHLGGTSVPVAVARSLVGPEGLIGVSMHTADELRALIGADFAFFGAVYATPGKTAVGPAALAAAVGAAAVPVLAIGGITVREVPAVRAAGAAGVAVIRAILGAPDPAAATHALVAALV